MLDVEDLINIDSNDLVLVTDSDLDGTGCHVLIKSFLPKTAIILGKSGEGVQENFFEEIDKYFKKEKYFLFTDLCPSEQVLDKLLNEYKKQVFVIDHHPHSVEILDKYLPKEQYYFNPEHSGTLGVAYCLFPKDMPFVVRQFAEAIDSYDRYEKKSHHFELGKQLNYFLWSVTRGNRMVGMLNSGINYEFQYQKFIQSEVSKIQRLKEYKFFPKEITRIEKEVAKEKQGIEKSRETIKKLIDSRGVNFLYCEAGAKISAIASNYLEENPDIRYVLVHSTFNKKDLKMSLRSRKGDYNIDWMAKMFGGGGHESASGFNFSKPKELERARLEGNFPDYIKRRKK